MTSTAFRDSAALTIAGGLSLGSVTVTIPATVQAGDFLLLAYNALSASVDTGGQGVISDPSGVTGWTAVDVQQSDSQMICKAWTKIAAPGDAGAAVTVAYTTDTLKNRAALAVTAWSSADRAVPVAVKSAWAASGTSATAHVMPTVNTTGKGPCRIISVWMGRESTTSTGYTASSGWTMRTQAVEASGAGCSIAVIDSGTDQAEGAALGAGTITGTQAATHNFSLTLALAESSAVATARPATDVTDSGWTGSATASPLCTLVADSDDTTYVVSPAAPVSQVWEAKLPEMTGPPNQVTNRGYFAGGAVSGTVVTALVQGTTVIASRTDSFSSGGTAPPTTPADLVLTLTAGQQAAITNLADLRIRCTVTAA